MKHAKQNLIRDWFSRNTISLLMISIGLLLSTIAILDTININYPSKLIPPQQLSYIALGLICVLFGYERIIDYNNLAKSISNINQTVKNLDHRIDTLKTYNYLETHNDLYRASLPLIEETKTKIRSVVYAKSPKAPDWWLAELIRIMKLKLDHANGIEFELILCVKEKDINEDFFRIADARYEKFKESGIEKHMHRYIHKVKKHLGHDLLIIDQKHVLFNYPTLNVLDHATKGLLFKNQPVVVEDLVNWYETFIKIDAIRYEELKSDFFKLKRKSS